MEGFTPWPDNLARSYRQKGYWTGVRLGDLPNEWAEQYGASEALVWGTKRLSYRELASAVDRLALGLLKDGLEPGSRVVVQLPNSGEFVVLCFALFRIGAIPVLALPAHREYEIGHLLDLSEASTYAVTTDPSHFDYLALARKMRASGLALNKLISDREARPGFTSIRHLLEGPNLSSNEVHQLDDLRPDPASVALFLLSGGTTGLPKLIPRTHDDYAFNFRRSAELCG
ncbi:MAG: AMP-binding protein, partial [Pseudomonadota bacterium]